MAVTQHVDASLDTIISLGAVGISTAKTKLLPRRKKGRATHKNVLGHVSALDTAILPEASLQESRQLA